MKLKFHLLTSIFYLLAPCAAPAAITATNLLTYQSVNGTNNGNSTALSAFYLPPTAFLIPNGGLASTQALAGDFQISLDNTNFVTFSTYAPSITNAQSDTYTPATSTPITVYARFRVRTTNAVNVGTAAIRTQ